MLSHFHLYIYICLGEEAFEGKSFVFNSSSTVSGMQHVLHVHWMNEGKKHYLTTFGEFSGGSLVKTALSRLLLLLLSRFSCVRLCATPQTAAHQAPPSLGFSRKNTGVGCHFLLQCMKVESESEVAQSCPTLSDPMDCSPPGSSIHGIFQARVLEWGAIAFSEIFIQFLLNHSMTFCYRYYQKNIRGLKNDRILIPLPAISTFSYTTSLPVVYVFLRTPTGICVTYHCQRMLFLQQIEFVQSQVRISSCLTSQGAARDGNGKSSALRIPAKRISSSASLHSPPHTHMCLCSALTDALSRSAVQFLLTMVI